MRIIAICDFIYPDMSRQCCQIVTRPKGHTEYAGQCHLRSSSRFLFGHPGKMAPQGLITAEQFEAVEMLGEGHLIKALVNALVAQPANPDARIQRALVHVLAKIRAAMNFARDQVMKGQINPSIT
jgi:hypothetical protein